jgi:hypothetical protein
MTAKMKRLPPALKHGGYSAKNILPGESSSAFRRLHRGIVAELCPDGAMEHEIVRSITQLLWRAQNLETLRKVELVKQRYQGIRSQYLPSNDVSYRYSEPPRREGGLPAAEDHAREALGENYELVEFRELATVECLMRELDVEERLNAMIDRKLKRLLVLRGIKSLPRASTSTPSNSLPAPSKGGEPSANGGPSANGEPSANPVV